ncbi:MAG: aspartate kinase [Candidatus Acidulodesulfobacterium acidiphilum]|uniref:Aspartokinase n=1 Tax=Candidatus Acidulodesulfobacterium acidiphilum TaxID=2597224 RepID=A0A520X7F4_9DELT|nr:MAG: aspartate kinase [Candidatus Acidulodesulfobacterium acidiphilum]
MALIVQKFGGTSMGSIERIKQVAGRVIKEKNGGNDVVVVVSAMSGETNRLLDLAVKMGGKQDDMETDLIISSGEQISSGLLSLALRNEGYDAVPMLGHQVRITTDESYGKARISSIDSENIRRMLKSGKIVVIAGFQGIDCNGFITTLGRGGSDTTAVAVAAAVKADRCDIFTDVDGVYTADPNIVPDARRLDVVYFDEMIEMSSLGAKVLQIRSVEFAMKYGVNLFVKSTFVDGNGTQIKFIGEEESMEELQVSSVACDKDEAKISIRGIPDRPGIAAKIFSKISAANIVVDMIIQNISIEGHTDLTFTVSKKDLKKALEITEELAKELNAKEVLSDDKIAKVSVIGVGMRNHYGTASTMFDVLAKENINIMMISTSEIKISCVIDAKYAELAARILHDAFNLGRQN